MKMSINEYFMKIEFDVDDDLRLNKSLNLYSVTVVVRYIFEEDDKLYPQNFLDECLYEV